MSHPVATATRPETRPGTIQIWSDLLCPFAHVAIHRLTVARERLGLTGRVHLDHHVFALELFNGPHPRPGTDSEAVGLGQIEPGAGWYTEILAPLAGAKGKPPNPEQIAQLNLAVERASSSSKMTRPVRSGSVSLDRKSVV